VPLHSMPNITGLQSKVQAQLTLSQAANTISILYPLLLILPKLPTANRSSTNRFTCGRLRGHPSLWTCVQNFVA